jgi:hypothetical protein
MNINVRAIALGCAFMLLSACSKSDGDRITDVLNQCAQTSHKAAAFNSSPGSQASYIATDAQKLDVSKRPPNFLMAYQALVNAWFQAPPYLANNNLVTSILEELAAGATEDTRVIAQTDQRVASATRQINPGIFILRNQQPRLTWPSIPMGKSG